jgi:hypothetical protein
MARAQLKLCAADAKEQSIALANYRLAGTPAMHDAGTIGQGQSPHIPIAAGEPYGVVCQRSQHIASALLTDPQVAHEAHIDDAVTQKGDDFERQCHARR